MAGGGEVEATLARLRREIDRIDEGMHRLLMERGDIIDQLIEAKRTVASGSAFRPDREAAMLRALAERHRGRLPLDAVEGIWRVVISTFTHLQAPFAVHGAGDAARMRDAARFHFGFSVPYREHGTAADVIAAVAGSPGDLGLLPIDGPDGPAWWRGLEGASAPKVIARLPFIERAGHPAGLPLLVVARSGAGTAAGDVALFVLPESAGLERGLRDLGGETLAAAEGSCLVALPGSCPVDEVAAGLAPGGPVPVPVGRHPSRFRVGPEA